MTKVKDILDDLLSRFQALGGIQKLLVAALGGGLLLAVLFWGFIGSNGDYGVLFANLSQEDAGAITAKLKGKKVPYVLEAGGSTILVPRSEVYDLRLSLAGEGIPRGGGVGFELFDRQTLGATEFVQRLNFQRALQGELARTIGRMPEIAEARVHIVAPKESLFVEGQKEARAAVAVKLRPGRFLSQPQIDGTTSQPGHRGRPERQNFEPAPRLPFPGRTIHRPDERSTTGGD
jgi:flagellar M-ring protein FliF